MKGEEYGKEIELLYKETGSLNVTADKILYRHQELGNMTGATVRKILVARGVKIKPSVAKSRPRNKIYYKKRLV